MLNMCGVCSWQDINCRVGKSNWPGKDMKPRPGIQELMSDMPQVKAWPHILLFVVLFVNYGNDLARLGTKIPNNKNRAYASNRNGLAYARCHLLKPLKNFFLLLILIVLLLYMPRTAFSLSDLGVEHIIINGAQGDFISNNESQAIYWAGGLGTWINSPTFFSPHHFESSYELGYYMSPDSNDDTLDIFWYLRNFQNFSNSLHESNASMRAIPAYPI